MSKTRLGFAISGSFCTFSKAISEMENLAQQGYDILPIMSFNAFNLDTKFGKAKEFIKQIENICNKKVIHSITDAEPIGPQNLTDIMIIAPCTGNTLGKLCRAITDTPVCMAAKSHLRVQKPLVLTVATNDALGASAQNIGKALNTKYLYFVPMRQDDPVNKPNSLVADFDLIPQTLELAFKSRQIQPIFT